MNELLENIINLKDQICLIKYQKDDDINLEIPFKFISIKDNKKLYGLNPAFNKDLYLDIDKINGFIHCEKNEQNQDLQLKIKNIISKKNKIDFLKNEYYISYEHHEDYIIYCSDSYSMFMIPFNFKNSLDLYKNENIENYIKIYKNLLKDKIKPYYINKINNLSLDYDADDPTIKSYVQSFLEMIDQEVNNSVITGSNPSEVILNSWPKVFDNIFLL